MTTKVHVFNSGPQKVRVIVEKKSFDGRTYTDTAPGNFPALNVGGHMEEYIHAGQWLRIVEVKEDQA